MIGRAIPDAALRQLDATFDAIGLGDHANKDKVWIVGGAVRDALLEVSTNDVDLVVDCDPAPIAKTIAQAVGGSRFQLSDRFGCWRIVNNSGEAAIAQIDVCQMVGDTIESDLKQRDFTINAIASTSGRSEELIDPTNGIADLAAGTVRMVSEQSLEDDPVRNLRAVRFATQLNFEIDSDTVAAVNSRAKRIDEPSGERVLIELRAMFEQQRAARAVSWLESTGLLEPLFPDSAMHADEAHEINVRLDDSLASPAVWSHCDPVALRIASLLLWSDDAGSVVAKWKPSSALLTKVVGVVNSVNGAESWLDNGNDARSRYRTRVSLGKHCGEALQLARATGDWDEVLIDELWKEHLLAQTNPIVPLLNGDEIASIAGIQPGPDLGRLVAELAEEQAVGAVSTVEEAKEWLREART